MTLEVEDEDREQVSEMSVYDYTSTIMIFLEMTFWT